MLQLFALEEVQSVEQMAHLASFRHSAVCGSGAMGAAAFDVVQQTTAAGVDDPGDGNAEHIEDQEQPQCADGAAGHGDGLP